MLAKSRLLSVMLLLITMSAGAADASREDKIKAGYIYNFAKLVNWPQTESSLDDTAFKICIMDSNIYKAAATLAGKDIHGKRAEVKKITASESVNTECKIIFLTKSANMDEVLETAKGLPILTLADTVNFVNKGGIIEMFVENNKIRFSINEKSAIENGLQISPRLSGLANNVIR